jgi:hypothetical protein
MTTHVLATSELISVRIEDARAQSIELFAQLAPEQREDLAHDTWLIGLRALANAHAQAQEAKLQDVGSSLLQELDRRLRDHVEQQRTTISSVLGTFFDPKDGQVSQRLDAFVNDHGVLARLLERYLAPQNSVLAESLARQVGETSPLFKKLSPTESDGLIKVLEGQLRAVMNEGHTELVRALDPLSEDGAVARFLKSLREELEGSNEDREKQLAAALAALDANDEGSLINRLARETHVARRAVIEAVNPDVPGSPMAVMRAALTSLLEKHNATQVELVRQQQVRQEAFEKEIREALTRMETKRSHDQKSARGGLDFESAVIEFVAASVKGAPCVFEVTGNSVGQVDRCKKGDAVARFTADSAYAGAVVVFEAKRDATYITQRALDELDEARRNRGASAGVFVMARSHAGDTFPRFARYGNNVLVVWDERDPTTDHHLHAAVLLGLALVARARTAGDEGDLAALRDIEARIGAEVERLGKMEKSAQAIRNHADKISEEIRTGTKRLDGLLGKAKATLRALKVELYDEDAERASPIAVPNGSLAAAQGALASGEEAAE